MSAWRKSPAKWSAGISFNTYLLVAAGFIALQALALLAMGQPPICECGYVTLWSGSVSGPENSQQLTDWYTYTHIIHGIAFYLILWLVAPATPIGLRFAVAVGIEAGWEVFENTPLIINRYREAALAQGYFGDSVINSLSDTVASVGGFVLARTLPVWAIGVLVIAAELFSAYMIRDNLVLNIVQLIYPSEAISNWQVGS
ncbi:DUF2585 family protein [Aurantimonas sp. A2-1-M11]|uniref:DUF2585 family protein n=1 Tax=Aurantimonas sp. A2-1-M11 TaxID=3113712 RepID=UPI002F945CCC